MAAMKRKFRKAYTRIMKSAAKMHSQPWESARPQVHEAARIQDHEAADGDAHAAICEQLVTCVAVDAVGHEELEPASQPPALAGWGSGALPLGVRLS